MLPTAHLLPDAPHRGIVINVDEMRLYYFDEQSTPVVTYPIGVGQEANSVFLPASTAPHPGEYLLAGLR